MWVQSFVTGPSWDRLVGLILFAAACGATVSYGMTLQRASRARDDGFMIPGVLASSALGVATLGSISWVLVVVGALVAGGPIALIVVVMYGLIFSVFVAAAGMCLLMGLMGLGRLIAVAIVP
jgi:hypothetical protein